MKIMMIPGERNEELILKVREATAPLHNEEGCEDSEYHECFEVIDNLIEEYGLVEIDANDSIHKKQVFFRKKIREVLAQKGIEIVD